MLAAKFFDDQYYNNAYYAQIGGVSTEEINTLEVEFLFMINFSLYVSREIYDQYRQELTKHMYSGCSCQQAAIAHNIPYHNPTQSSTSIQNRSDSSIPTNQPVQYASDSPDIRQSQKKAKTSSSDRGEQQ